MAEVITSISMTREDWEEYKKETARQSIEGVRQVNRITNFMEMFPGLREHEAVNFIGAMDSVLEHRRHPTSVRKMIDALDRIYAAG